LQLPRKLVRRIYIPKANGTQQSLGIAALEGKIAQCIVVTVSNAIYDSDFVLWPTAMEISIY
jgi:RNA-directed DNA polymerase